MRGNNKQKYIYFLRKKKHIDHPPLKKDTSSHTRTHRMCTKKCDNSHKKKRFVASEKKGTIHKEEEEKHTRKNIKKIV
jgi:hypothetical protein